MVVAEKGHSLGLPVQFTWVPTGFLQGTTEVMGGVIVLHGVHLGYR